MKTAGAALLAAGIFCLAMANRSRGMEEKITPEAFPEFSDSETEECRKITAVIRRRTVYLAAALLATGAISLVNPQPASVLYGLIFVAALFIGNVIPRQRLAAIMNRRGITPEHLRARGIRF